MKFGELIAIGRECKGWTLRDMERETGVSNALISQIEHGHVKDCGFSTAIILIDALGISLERAAKTVRPSKPSDITHTVVGEVSGQVREANQVPGMPHAICHACGLGNYCGDVDCPNSNLKCKTCGDRKEIGGFVMDAAGGGYETHPCPDCTGALWHS